MKKRMSDIVEKKIISTMIRIRKKEITPKESGIGKSLSKMKILDEALYEELIIKYKEILKN